MERLNKYIDSLKEEVKQCLVDCGGCCILISNDGKCECENANKICFFEQLKSYKEAEEQGLLLRLQFRVGDFVWDDEFKSRYKITGYSFGTAEDYIDDPVSETELIYYYTNYCGSITGSFSESEIGKTIFHTEEEAEAALEKMKGE